MRIATLLLAATLGCGAVYAQAAPAAAPITAAAARVEPGAVDALVKMSAYLRTLPAFQITLETQRDDVDVYGQLITLSGEATYKVRRPDSLMVDLALPTISRQYVYDGKTFTVFDPKSGYYAKVQAPPTIRATLDMASEQYGVTLPLEDLFTWSENDADAKVLTSAHFVGKTRVAGQDANHYAFRQPGIDWQIWIADGDKPAPLRVLIVAADDPARPKFQADLVWDIAPQFAADTFVFAPPANSRSIAIHPLAER